MNAPFNAQLTLLGADLMHILTKDKKIQIYKKKNNQNYFFKNGLQFFQQCFSYTIILEKEVNPMAEN